MKIDKSSKGDEDTFKLGATSSVIEFRWVGDFIALRRAKERLYRGQ